LTQSLRSQCVALLLDVYLDSSSSTCCTFQWAELNQAQGSQALSY
jgi:hypothetical protein